MGGYLQVRYAPTGFVTEEEFNVWVTFANGGGVAPASCWQNDASRREPHTYTTNWAKSRLSTAGTGVDTREPTVGRETTTLPGDSSEGCDVWDVLVQGLKIVPRLCSTCGTSPRSSLEATS